MGYQHIENLYRFPELLECFALEKIHGTSAHVAIERDGDIGPQVRFFAGGGAHDPFVRLFDESALREKFLEAFGRGTAESATRLTIYGEAFGGKCQGMSATYGKVIRFLAFDVKLDGVWLDVLSAAAFVEEFGIGFVPYARGPLSLEWINTQRDRDSEVAIAPGKMREGVVIRPIYEMRRNNGERVIVKHKRPEFSETKTPREVDPAKAVILSEASAIAAEWVTPMRLQHVLQGTPFAGPEDTGKVIRAMQEDIRRESAGEFVWNKDVERAIGRATAALLHKVPSLEES